jgi:phospholipid/cholesterol/gamma-HCH transport system permease protein
MAADPSYVIEPIGEGLRATLKGGWTLQQRDIEYRARDLARDTGKARLVAIDIGSVEAMDTAGAWLIDRCRQDIERRGAAARIERSRPEHAILMREAHWRDFAAPTPPRGSALVNMLADIGHTLEIAARDFARGLAWLGEVIGGLVRLLLRPWRFRVTSLVYHLESFALRSLPIVALINFIVGCIVAQQGIFQLRRFGASAFAVDLIGILVLRELAVLLTSIMIAGRSGSAITAELGSMKMREEIDALRVMGLDPVEVLVVPRVLALIVALPLLTFLADMAAIFGGLVVSWSYGAMSPEIFMSRLKDAIAMNTFLVGLIKAPFMALIIGIVSTLEGMTVEGSAESLGERVTASVVKSIFMVIVIDGLFAMFFAAIDY